METKAMVVNLAIKDQTIHFKNEIPIPKHKANSYQGVGSTTTI
jgi:hypothetical protein